MAYALNDFALTYRFGLKARVQHMRAAFDQWTARRSVYRRTADELHALTDRDLADLGIDRSEIPRLAREAARAA